MAKCKRDHEEIVEFNLYLKLGSRYYCPQCHDYLGADPPPSMNLPRTWWRTMKGEYKLHQGSLGKPKIGFTILYCVLLLEYFCVSYIARVVALNI